VRAGIWTAILVVMAVAIPTASEAQSCANGDLEFYDSICSCGGGSRLLALCADNPDSDAMCENVREWDLHCRLRILSLRFP
jgi:hypothetical protein